MTKEFKLIVAGGRDFNDYELLSRTLFAMADVELADKDVSIVSGMARGADALGHRFAKTNHVMVYEMHADWNLLKEYMYVRRNEHMCRFADGLLAFTDNKDSGTAHMIDFMKSLNKPVTVVRY